MVKNRHICIWIVWLQIMAPVDIICGVPGQQRSVKRARKGMLLGYISRQSIACVCLHIYCIRDYPSTFIGYLLRGFTAIRKRPDFIMFSMFEHNCGIAPWFSTDADRVYRSGTFFRRLHCSISFQRILIAIGNNKQMRWTWNQLTCRVIHESFVLSCLRTIEWTNKVSVMSKSPFIIVRSTGRVKSLTLFICFLCYPNISTSGRWV